MDTPTNSGSPPYRTGRLDTASAIRREMARVYRATRNDELPSDKATKLVYILTAMLKAIEVGVLEERLDSLEALAAKAAQVKAGTAWQSH